MPYLLIAAGTLTLFLVIYIVLCGRRIKELREEKNNLAAECNQQLSRVNELNEKIIKFNSDIEAAKAELTKLHDKQIFALQAADMAQARLKSEHERVAAELKHVKELEEEKMKHEFEKKTEAMTALYLEKENNAFQHYTELSNTYNDALNTIKFELDEYSKKRKSVHEAILRERELEEKEDFYRIVIKDNDTKDIEVLRSIEPRLTNREVLNKLIYEVFIKRPLSEMEKRVLQSRKIGGIYKITYIKTGEAYIGRSVDIANRWKEHVLSSLNIGTIAHSTFHNTLADKGLQNFTWEVLEEVDKDKQSSREKYWIEFYQTDKQFNQKAGG